MQKEQTILLFKNELKKNNLRNTSTKQKIFNYLHKSSKPESIQQISSQLSDIHFVSIYRSIDQLVSAGIVSLVPSGFKSLYELSDVFKPHHHHAICTKCSKIDDIDIEPIENLLRNIGDSIKMEVTGHHFEINGICSNCKK